MSQAPAIVLIVTDPAGFQAVLDEEASYRVLDADSLDEDDPGESPLAEGAPGPEDGPDLVISPLRPADRALALYRRIQADPQIPAVPALLLAPTASGESSESDLPTESVFDLPGVGATTREGLRALVAHRLAVCNPAAGPPLDPDTSFRERVEAVVERNLDVPRFAVEELAGALGMSRRHLTRRMKGTFDRAPAAYIRARRLDRAKTLLAGDPPSVAAVAEAVGFRSASAFTEAFREATGQVPSDYAHEHDDEPP
jgi:AraC-like DNA-binding protein